MGTYKEENRSRGRKGKTKKINSGYFTSRFV